MDSQQQQKPNLRKRGKRLQYDPASLDVYSSANPQTDSDSNAAGSQSQGLRSMNMSTYGAQPSSRQTPRLQNTQKTGLGNGNAGAGWAFNTPSSGGFGGLGGVPGLGQVRPGQLSGFAQVMGGGSGQGPIDMSDFPTLSNGPRSQQASSSWNSSIIRQPPPQASAQQPQQQQRAPSTAPSHHSLEQLDAQRSQQPSTDRNSAGGDEFPPLNEQINGSTGRQTNGFASSLESPGDTHPPLNGQQTHLPIRDVSASMTSSQQPPIGTTPPGIPTHSQNLPTETSNGSTNRANPDLKKYSDMTDSEKWGLAGLSKTFQYLNAIETGAPIDDTFPVHLRNGVHMAMGQDLTNLGMDLESTEPIGPSFAVFPSRNHSGSLYDYRDRHPVPDFVTPPGYIVNNVPPEHARVSAFSDETLFMIFYTKTRDIMQELAAAELSRREWHWHKIIRQWITKDSRETTTGHLNMIDHTGGAPIGVPPVRLSENSERGIYIFFDAPNWRRERKEFILNYDELEHRNAQGAIISAPVDGPVFARTGGPPGMGGAATGMGGQQGGGAIERQT